MTPERFERTLRRANVLCARALRTLPDGERHLLAFPHRVEGRAGAGRLMEEVLGAVGSGDEAEAFVGDALDGAGRVWCHGVAAPEGRWAVDVRDGAGWRRASVEDL